MLIGITGTDGAGKGAVVKYLVKKKGYTHYSGRALFLEIFEQKGIEPSREHMRLVANELRREQGNDTIVTTYLQRAQEQGVTNIIIESIRATAEAKTLQARGGVLLAVDANPRIRYRRITGRGSKTDKVSFKQFQAHEALEMNDPDPNGMQKAQVMQMADHTIKNEGTLKELHQSIEQFLENYHS